ncbi:MAG: family 2 glycosyl transferase [Marinobacter sp. T13-3]|nr:MAG: family 2 glycosyl transferase [Marinobacter sp. T13-3]
MKSFAIEPYPSEGWYLIKGNLPGHQARLRVWAILELECGARRIPLSASLKGRVFELLPRPENAHEIRLEIEGENGFLPPDLLSLKPVSHRVAWRALCKRLFGVFRALDADKAKRLGLSWWTLLTRPFCSYRVLSALRYHYPAPEYARWREHYWPCSSVTERRLSAHLKQRGLAGESVAVLLDARGGVRASEFSAENQLSLRTKVVALTAQSGDWPLSSDNDSGWVLYTRPDQKLEPWALAWFLTDAMKHPEAVLVYSDHALLDSAGTPTEPRFKPDWSPELQAVSHYIGDCVLVKRSALKDIFDTLGYLPSVYELALELGVRADPSQIRHVPAVLWHQAGTDTQPCEAQLEAHYQRHNQNAEITRDDRGHLRVHYGLPARAPKISIVIPTRDALHLLKPCVDSILDRTSWPDYEILILDNQSSCADTLAYLQAVESDNRVRVLAYPYPFNYSAINNFAVEHARGELVCLLNNDTEVISPDWLEEMASRLLQPGVGAVGARLYFADGRVQHAGDVLGPGGCACHLHGVIEADDPGYMNRAVLPQELSAVTAACLLTYRSLYQELGGLDEENLAVAFNDVDFCLRIREAGYRVVYTPYAELYHYESVSRGKDDDPVKKARAEREVAYMRARWADVIERDPFYNPNLNYAKPDFTLGKYPRIDWPW